MRVSMDDVAREAGVSKTTVSHVVNQSRAVSQEAETRVRKAIRKLDYKVNTLARHLRVGTTHMIGYVVSNLTNYFYINVASGLNTVFKPAGYKLFYVNSSEDDEVEKNNIQDMVNFSADGLIVAPTSNNCGYMNDLIPESLPTVFIDRKPRGIVRDSVLPTNRLGVYEAVRDLISRGHRRIGFVGSRHNDTMSERHEGYRQALEKTGIPYEPDLVLIGDIAPSPMHDLLNGYLHTHIGEYLGKYAPSALMIGNGLAAIGVFNYLKQHNIRIPEDLALIAFDDSFWYSTATPAISAVRQNPYEIGVRAGERLLSRLNGSEEPYEEKQIPTELIRRESY